MYIHEALKVFLSIIRIVVQAGERVSREQEYHWWYLLVTAVYIVVMHMFPPKETLYSDFVNDAILSLHSCVIFFYLVSQPAAVRSVTITLFSF